MRKNAIALALAVAACAGNRSGQGDAPRVADADLGRLGQEQMQPVDDARRYLSSARDELARARLRLEQTKQEVGLAGADQQSADADQQRAAAQARIAEQSREPAQLERARQMQEKAQLAKGAAEARLDWAGKLVASRQTAEQAAQRQVQLGEARLEQSKLRALQVVGIPAAGKYDPARFQTQVDGTQQAFDAELAKAREQEGQAVAAQQHYEDLQRRMQASGGAAPTGG